MTTAASPTADSVGASPGKPAGSEYGYLLAGELIGCSREQLIEKAKQVGLPALDFVWTPEHEGLVPPGEVPFLLDLYRAQARKDAARGIWWGLVPVTLVGFFVVVADLPWWQALYNLWFVLGVAVIGFGVWSLRRSKLLTAQDVAEQAQAIKFAEWLKARGGRRAYTKALAATLVVVGCAQALVGAEASIDAAGLVKSAVRGGEVWRLLTGAMLHGSLMHIWFNLQALWEEGRFIETVTHRSHLPIVFLASALAGSVFSLLLYPNATSVGASGGLMGMIGYQLVLARRRKERLPAGFYRSVVTSILFIGLLGAVGFALIDNAAHFGGLLAGAACAHRLIGGPGRDPPAAPGRLVAWLSYASMAVIGAAGVWAVVVMAGAAVK